MTADRNKEGQVDVALLLRSLWERRGFILRVAGVFVALALVAAIFGEVKYTASCVVVPQTGRDNPAGNLQGLAAMAGINLGTAGSAGELSPNLYPMVVGSVPFRRDMMRSVITVNGQDVTLLDYLTDRRYRKLSPLATLKKYTVGLPAVAVRAVKGDGALADTTRLPTGSLTPREYECMRIMATQLAVAFDDKNGYITLSATMPEARVAAEVASRAQELLQQYITRFRVQKVQADLDFIEERFGEAKADFEASQRALAAFQDSHRDIASAIGRAREDRLENDYNLAFTIYSELARQREQAGIRVKEDTPVFTVIEPVTVPVMRSAPRRVQMVVSGLAVGIVVGMALVLVLPFFARVFDFGWLGAWRENKTEE